MTVNIDPLSGRSPNGEPDAGRPVLDIDHLQVTFATDGGPVHAVKDVSLEVRKGEVLAIVGESGSGKTVTAKTILGLLPETASSSGAVKMPRTLPCFRRLRRRTTRRSCSPRARPARPRAPCRLTGR